MAGRRDNSETKEVFFTRIDQFPNDFNKSYEKMQHCDQKEIKAECLTTSISVHCSLIPGWCNIKCPKSNTTFSASTKISKHVSSIERDSHTKQEKGLNGREKR